MLKSLHIARGMAALLVALFHLAEALGSAKYFSEPVFAYVFAAGGAAGVNFFFVLSGFIITFVHWGDIGTRHRLLAYALKRAVRIYPVYWFVFAAVYIGAMFMPNLRETLPEDPFVLAKSIFLAAQDPGAVGGTGAPVIVVAWSLQYEILFYLFFGLLIFDVRCAIAALTAAFLGWSAGRFLGWDLPLKFLEPAYFVLFAIGVLAALAVRFDRCVRCAYPAAVLGALLFVLTAAEIGASRAFPEIFLAPGATATTLLFGAGSGLMVFGLATLEKNNRNFANFPRPAMVLGDMSYALYLVHYPLVSLGCKTGRALGLSGIAGASICGAATFIACLVAAWMLHRTIERPLLDAARRAMLNHAPRGHRRLA